MEIYFMLALLIIAIICATGGIQQRQKRKPLAIALAVVAAVALIGLLALRNG